MVELNVMPEINASAVHGLFMDDRRYRLANKTIDGDVWAVRYLPDYWPATHDLQLVLGTRAAHLAAGSKPDQRRRRAPLGMARHVARPALNGEVRRRRPVRAAS